MRLTQAAPSMRSVDLLAADKGQGSCPAHMSERTGQRLIIGDAVEAAAQWSPRSVEGAVDLLAQFGLAAAHCRLVVGPGLWICLGGSHCPFHRLGRS